MQVVKRDGSLQEFDSNKIVEAISKAFNACCPDENRDVINAMVSDMHLWDGITIEEIQDEVIEVLRDYGYDEVADNYLLYRKKHEWLRHVVDSKKKFIESYKEANNTANATIDDNSNVSGKNIFPELHKTDWEFALKLWRGEIDLT